MYRLIVCVILVSFVFSGCAKREERKHKFASQEEVLNLSAADTILAGSADESVEWIDETKPVVTNISIKVPIQDAAPLVLSSESADARGIQTALRDLGLYGGSIDGKIGPKTKAAIREFQRNNGLVVDGKVGAKTWTKLKEQLVTKP